MDDKNIIENHIEKNECETPDTEIVEGISSAEEKETKNPKILLSGGVLSADEEEFSDIKQYPESPFTYFETNQINVQLSTGNVQYEATDFVLPGRDGFDVSIARRYDSGCANLVDMDPYIKNGELKTGSKVNSFYTSTYGLGYGWSFVLPSIETVSYIKYNNIIISVDPIKSTLIGTFRSDYILHLEDGKSLKISRSSDKFEDYSLKDVRIITRSGTIQHPYATNISKSYDIIIEYKNGNKDYFKNLFGESGERNKLIWSRFTLAARQDKFGNVVCYDMRGPDGMVIVDTWGRKISLEKTDYGLIWRLPESTTGRTCELSYHIDHVQPLKLTAVTDSAGHKTQYNYFNPENYKGIMSYASKKAVGNTTGNKERKYLLLKSITYPNYASTEFTYGRKISIVNSAGGKLTHFALTMKQDIADGAEYNRAEYRYRLDSGTSYEYGNGNYIEYAEVKNHQDILENHQFDQEGHLQKKEVRNQEALISKNVYKYSNKLIVSEVDQIFDRNNESNFLEKKTSWKYSADQKANIIQIMEEYPDDPSCNQEINTSYGDYSIILETERKNGSNQIKETNELHIELGKRVIKYHRIYENGVLKEKTEYDFKDSKNPYCVTNERRFFLAGSENLEQSGDYVETIYKYSNTLSTSSRYTHSFISKEQTGIIDADGRPCNPIKEEFQYDNWGRLISKKDSRNHVSTICYDGLGRVEAETFPPVDGQAAANKTYYNDRLNYITETDANHQKRRIQYTPFGQIQQICLAVSNEPASGDVVLQDFRYNSWGELTEAVTYNGNGTAPDHVRKTERYTYDSFGRVLTRMIPQVSHEEKYEYNEVFIDPTDGRKYHREQKKIIGDVSAPDIVTECYKDQKGQIRRETLAGERLYTYEYDNAGNNIRKIDTRNKVERWEYDYAGRVIKSIRTESGQERITSIQYDALGNKLFHWDEAKKSTKFQYDKAGRLVQIAAPFDQRSQIVKYYYDGAGNVIGEKKKQKDGWQEIQYVYNARNQLTETYQYLSPSYWIKTACQYDAVNQVILRRTGDTPAGQGWEVTKYVYDRFGNVTAMTDARDCTEYYEYDKAGRLQKKMDRNKDHIFYQHDALERLIKETVQKKTSEGLVTSQREYVYSKNGKLILEISRESVGGKQTVFLETKYRYNHKGQLSNQEDPGNIEKNYTYDIYGNRQSFQLTQKGNASPDVSLYYIYDDLYRLKQVRKNSAAGVILAEYEYDEKGNRKKLRYSQSDVETSYKYNDGNRIISLQNKHHGTLISEWEYVYDVDGNILGKINKAGSAPVTISYCYDRLGRLTEEDYSDWKRTLYTYDAYSNRMKMMVEGRTKDELVSVTSYEYGLNNRLEKETKKQGKITETYRYRYDDNGNETFRIWEKTSPTPDYPGNVKLSGNYQMETPTVYEWRHYDGFNQLSRINQDDKEITYQYRGDGLRHSAQVRRLTENQGKTNLYCWDGSDIVAEQADGSKIKTYLRGINLVASEIDRVVYYYIFNEHGDVTQLWSHNGTCKASYEYDAFGVERNLDKEDKNPFRYYGEYFDINSGRYYLRARYYDPAIGRFLAEDTHWNPTNMIYGDNLIKWNEQPAVTNDPLGLSTYTYKPDVSAIMQSGNLYVYAGNNPILYVDSNGEIFMLVTGAIGAVAGGIGGAIYSQVKYGEVRWQNIAAGAAIGGAVGLTGGAAAGAIIAGSATASTGAVLTGMGVAGATASAGAVYKTLEKGVDFTQTTLTRMNNPNRFVPVQTLIQAIKSGAARPDPQGTKAIMYTIELFKSGKAYNLEVLYDKATNTILHFLYK